MNKILSMFLLVTGLAGLPTQAICDEPTPDDLDRLVAQCAACHGMDGNSNNNSIPSFAGINENYFKYAIEEYKNGNRNSPLMKNFADNLSPEEIDKLAKYYEKQTYKPIEQPFDQELAQKGKVLHDKYCAKCHDNNGYVDPHNFGILAGQGIPYLKSAIKEYLDGTRKANPIMTIKLRRVQNDAGEAGLDQLVNFYASVKHH